MASLLDMLVEQTTRKLTKKEQMAAAQASAKAGLPPMRDYPPGSAPWELYGNPVRFPPEPAAAVPFEPAGLLSHQPRRVRPDRTVETPEVIAMGDGANRVKLNQRTPFTGPMPAAGAETAEQLARRADVASLYAARNAAEKPYDSMKGAVGAGAAGVGIGAGLLGIDRMGPRADLSSPVPGGEQPLHSPVPVDLTTPEGLRAEVTRKKDQLSRDTGKSIKDLEKQATDAIASTIPEGQRSDFLKSIEGLDILNFSMAMLANNNGEMNTGQVLGLAFQTALKQKEGRDQLKVENKFKDRAATAEEERAAATTTAAGASVLNAETNAKYTPVGLGIDAKNAEANMMRAQADMVAAAQGTTGTLRDAGMLVGKPMTSTQMSEAQMYLGEVLGENYKLKLGDKGRVGDTALVDATAQAIAAERNYRTVNRIPQPFTRADAIAIAQRVAEPVIAAGVTTDGPGWSTTHIEPSMLNPGGYSASNPGPRVPQAEDPRMAEIRKIREALGKPQ